MRLLLTATSWDQPRWVGEALDEAIATGGLAVVGLCVLRSSAVVALDVASGPLQRGYAAFDRRRFAPDPTPLERVDLRQTAGSSSAPDVAMLDVDGPGALAGVLDQLQRTTAFDVILNLAEQVDTGLLARHAPSGAASFVLGESRATHLPSGYPEVLRGSLVTRVQLRHWGADGGPGHATVETTTNAHPFSAGRTASLAADHAVPLLARFVRRLLDRPAAGGNDEGAPVVPDRDRKRAPVQPAEPRVAPRWPPLTQLTGLARLGGRYARYLTHERNTREQWMLGWHRRPSSGVPSPSAGGDGPPDAVPELDLSRYRHIVPPTDRFWADPFALRVGGRDFLLMEELVYAEGVGHLSVIELGPEGPLGPPTPVLQRPYHLSYPYVFRHEGALFLVPEMALEGRLEVYRATKAPFEWELHAVMLEGPMLLDATVQEINGRWWLFACEYRVRTQPWTDLLLFHADSPFGPWTPHRRNPVVSDVRRARPAGRLFRHDGWWVRPAQDCARSYGERICLQRITRLTPDEYEEEALRALDIPGGKRLRGPHTLSADGGLSTIDFKRRISR